MNIHSSIVQKKREQIQTKYQPNAGKRDIMCNWGHKEVEQCPTNGTQIYRDGSKYAVNVQNTAKHTTK